MEEDKTILLSLKLKDLEDQMDKACKACMNDSQLFRQQSAIYYTARRFFELVETLEEAGLEHSDAIMLAMLHYSRFYK